MKKFCSINPIIKKFINIFNKSNFKNLNIQNIYFNCPIFIQNTACSLYGFNIVKNRYGRTFKKHFLKKKDIKHHSNLNFIKKTRNEKLRILFKAAYYTDFWKEKFDKYNVNIFATDLTNELKKLPITSKQEIKNNIKRISLEKKYLKEFTSLPLMVAHTSGTTGSGLIFKETKESDSEKWATCWRYRDYHSITSDMWCGIFAGRTIVSPTQKKPPFWRINFPGKQILFSSYHISEKNIMHYLLEIKRINLKWLHGYPSSLSLIAEYILKNNLEKMLDINIVTTGAENLFEYQRLKIEKAFRCKVKDYYGQAEGVAIFSQINQNSYVVEEDYSLVEFLPSEFNESYKIIGTNINNIAFPLIRYDTEDLAKIDNSIGNHSQNNWRIVESIDGRDEDYLVLKDGSKIGRLDHLFKDIIKINEAQFFQDKMGFAILKIVVNTSFRETDLSKLKQEIDFKLGNRIDIEIIITDKSIKTKTGKMRLVISKLGKKYN